MNDCQQTQTLLLDHLYGLLDETESQALLDHVADCHACRTALEHAQSQQRLLAAAAREPFPAVRFEAPAESQPVEEEAAVLPLVKPAARRRRWVPWAVAAAVLLVAGAFGAPAGWFARDFAKTHNVVKEHEAAVAQAKIDFETHRAELKNLPKERDEKFKKVEQEGLERQMNVVVIGESRLPVGAPSEYRIQTRNLAGRSVPARLDVRLVDQTGRTVFEEKDKESEGEYRVTFQPNLPLRPDTTLALDITARRKNDDANAVSSLHEHLELTAPVYVTHLATDKPMYQPGEKVYFRSLTLERFGLTPPQEDFRLIYTIADNKGTKTDILAGSSQLRSNATVANADILGPDGKPVRGLGAGEYTLLANAPGGEWTLSVREASNRFPPQERKFIVNSYRPSSLSKELNFDRSSYGAGDTVVARVKLHSGKEAAAGCRVVGTITIDGHNYGADGKPNTVAPVATADGTGLAEVAFKLPAQIERGQGTLSLNFDYRGVGDDTSRTIPLIVNKLLVHFYPEGGELVAGTPNRVYFQSQSTLDKPADLRGRLVDDTGKVVVPDVQTLNNPEEPGANQGMGAFIFTPEVGRHYELKIDSPIGIKSEHRLSEPKADGVALLVADGVTGPDDPIRVTVTSPRADRKMHVGAYCRGRLLDYQSVAVKQGVPAEVALKPARGVGGVYRITVFEELPGADNRRQLVPRAERLVYREAAETLKLSVEADRKQYVPGDRVTLSLTARDEMDRPTGAILLTRAVDQRVLKLADEKTARSMPTHYYLTSEVRKPDDLEHADFLLTAHPQARTALDLLLGTQGWRRFAEQNPQQFRNQYKRDADRYLVMTVGQVSPTQTDFAQLQVEQVKQEFDQRFDATEAEFKKSAEALTAIDVTAPAQIRLRQYQDWFARLSRLTVPLLALLLVVLVLLGVFLGLPRRFRIAVPYYAGLTACAVLMVVLFTRGYLQRESSQQLAMAQADVKAAREAENAAAAPGQWGAAGGLPMAGGAPVPLFVEKPMAPPQMANMMAPDAFAADGMKRDQPGDDRAEGVKEEKLLRDEQHVVNDLAKLKGEAKKAGANGFADKAPPGEALFELAGAALPGKPGELADRKNVAGEVERVRGLLEQPPGGPAAQPAFGGGGGFGGRRPGNMMIPPPPQPLVVREYAHVHVAVQPNTPRSDFAETLLWKPALVIPADGKATVSFDLCDSVAAFEVLAVGHTLDGRIGSVTTLIESKLPFTLEPKVPIEIGSSDRIDLPVALANNTPTERSVNLGMTTKGLKLLGGESQQSLIVKGNDGTRRLFAFRPEILDGEANLTFTGQAAPFAADAITRKVRVVPDGFPVVGSKSDLLERTAVNEIELPKTWVKGTLKCRVDVYPSTLATLTKGLESLLREPNGCFEQTSTSNYPNLLILDYLKESDQARPEIEARARDLMARGYQKLTSFECPKTAANTRQGYEWFGAPDGAHEALTAYGLLQFRDMSRVYKVDPAMLERTREYLLASRDGKGGFKRNTRALDTFGRAPDNITNAYIVWAITESGKEDDVTTELNALHAQAKTSKDAYFLALVANALLNRNRTDDAIVLLKTIVSLQKDDGHLDAEKTSITGSGGRDLQIETTGLATLGWLKANRPELFTPSVEKAVKWIGQQRGGYGGFGSTQSTILALKALIAHARANKKAPDAGELSLLVGDVRVSNLKFPAGAQDALTIELPDAEKYLKEGKNTVRVEMSGKNSFPYTLSWSYQTLTPVSAEGCAVRVSTKLDKAAAGEGDAVNLTVTLENVSGKGQGMALAVVGIPAGLTLPEDLKQLKEHARLRENETKPGLIGAFEVRPRELILYWRDLAPGQKIEVPVALTCRIPGEYRGPASRAYLYYNADHKHWVEPLEVKIAPKE